MMAAVKAQQPALNTAFFMKSQSAGPSPPEADTYAKGAFASPASSTPPSTGISPTNLHASHQNIRQLRQPRQPLYVPAALRPPEDKTKPTDIPSRPRAPDTPPSSKDNSFDSGHSVPCSLEEPNCAPLTTVESHDVQELRRGLSRAASDSLDQELGEVTGHPTTAHWKPDSSAVACAICLQPFTWFWRRHHCRRCGDIVCENHSSKRIPLDQNARYHPQGIESRACDPCHSEWIIIQKLRHSRTSSIAESQNSSQGTAMPPLPIPSTQRNSDDVRIGSMARSEGMVWSTF